MDKLIFVLILLLGLLLALHFSIGAIVGLLFWLFLITGIFSRLFRGKFPHNFFLGLLGILIGPVLICCLINLLLYNLPEIFASGFGSATSAIVLLILMTASFLYVRRRILGTQSHGTKDLQTNERRPLLPSHHEATLSSGDDHAGH
jgi:hypothetical protein